MSPTNGCAALRVAYLVRRFPVLSETFVMTEILDHLRNGLDLDVIVLDGEDRADFPLSEAPPELSGHVHYLGASITGKSTINKTAAAAARRMRAAAASFPAVQDAIYRSHRRFDSSALLSAWSRLPRSYDVLHCHFGDIGSVGAFLKWTKTFQGTLIATIHGFEISKALKTTAAEQFRLLFDESDVILPVSAFWAHRLTTMGCDPNKVVVQRMGIDLAHLPAPRARADAGFHLVSVGRFTEKKAHADSVRAFAQAAQVIGSAPMQLEIVGTGPLFEEVRHEAERTGVADRVRLLGSRTHAETLDLISTCDAFILPSVVAGDGDMEGIPVAIMEAMALRKPVISTFHSGIPELVVDGVSGLLAPERDVGALCSFILRLAEDPGLRATLGSAARDTIQRDFNAERLGVGLRTLYARTHGEAQSSTMQ